MQLFIIKPKDKPEEKFLIELFKRLKIQCELIKKNKKLKSGFNSREDFLSMFGIGKKNPISLIDIRKVRTKRKRNRAN